MTKKTEYDDWEVLPDDYHSRSNHIEPQRYLTQDEMSKAVCSGITDAFFHVVQSVMLAYIFVNIINGDFWVLSNPWGISFLIFSFIRFLFYILTILLNS